MMAWTPPDRSGFATRNWFLAALPTSDLRRLQPHLEPVLLTSSGILLEADQPLTRLYFVETGIVSLVSVLDSRITAGVATIGREGLVGIAALLGGDTALGRYVAGMAGSALSVEASRFRGVIQKSPKARAVCEAYAQAFFGQVLQAVACNRLHEVEQRCARWLLMCHDQTEADVVELTQEHLAEMLGVRRSTITAVFHTFEKAGLIRYHGGEIAVQDRRGLEAGACECYRIVRSRYDRLLTRPRAAEAIA